MKLLRVSRNLLKQAIPTLLFQPMVRTSHLLPCHMVLFMILTKLEEIDVFIFRAMFDYVI